MPNATCQIVFLENRVGDFCVRFPCSNNRHLFKGSADDLSPLILSYCHKRTTTRVKNLRHGFSSSKRCDVYRALPGVEFTQTYAFVK